MATADRLAPGNAERILLDGAGQSSIGDAGWFGEARRQARQSFELAGLPHRRLEDWRYTDLRQILEKRLGTRPGTTGHAQAESASDNNISSKTLAAVDAYVALITADGVDGDFSTLPEGAEITSLASVLGESWVQNAMSAVAFGGSEASQATKIIDLNTAMLNGGVAIHIARGVKLEKPIRLVFSGSGTRHLRTVIVLEEGASARLIESHEAGANAFSDLVSDIRLSRHSTLTRIKVQNDAGSAIHLASDRIVLAEDAVFDGFLMTLGAAVSRNQSFTLFAGERAKAIVNGVYALRGSQHGDHFCLTDHAVPDCQSVTLFKGVLDEASVGVFQGRVLVRPDAQKTDGRQANHALLLSRDATMNAKPELEIYADDVQCAHGSTIGELDRNAIFYLRSRGLDERAARQLLISAFLDEVFEAVPHEGVRDILRDMAAAWFVNERSRHHE